MSTAVEMLIKAGADLHARLDSGFTPLLFAVREGRIGVVQALLKAGADVNETIQTRHTAGRQALAAGAGAPRSGPAPCMLAVGQRALRTGGDPAGRGRGSRMPPAPATRRCTRSLGCANRAAATTIRAPEGSGNMTSLRIGEEAGGSTART